MKRHRALAVSRQLEAIDTFTCMNAFSLYDIFYVIDMPLQILYKLYHIISSV